MYIRICIDFEGDEREASSIYYIGYTHWAIVPVFNLHFKMHRNDCFLKTSISPGKFSSITNK